MITIETIEIIEDINPAEIAENIISLQHYRFFMVCKLEIVILDRLLKNSPITT